MKSQAFHMVLPVTLLLATGCGNDNTEIKSMDRLHEEYGVPVRIETVTAQPFSETYTFNGSLTGVEETSAVSLIGDTVESVNYKVGDYVRKDQVVITFPDDNPQARYHQARVAMEHAKTTLDRIEKLYADGGISLQELDNTRTRFKVAEADWESVRGTITVKAPIDGVITRIDIRESDRVKAGDTLFTVSKTDRLKAEIWAGEDRIRGIRQGQEANASWRGVVLTGHVVQVDRSLDEKRQAFRVVAEFRNPGGAVLSGANAEITIAADDDTPSVLISRNHIRRDGDTWYVYIAENGNAVRRPIRTGRSIDVDVEILGGLEQGDSLITEGLNLLSDGVKIRTVND